MRPAFLSALDVTYASALQHLPPAEHARLEAAYKLCWADGVHPDDAAHCWQVQGREERLYIVAHEEGAWHCTCESASYRPMETCKHVYAAMLHVRAMRASQEQAVLVPEQGFQALTAANVR